MNFSSTQNHALPDIKEAMIKEFKKPKSESQCITELKEIQQKHDESVRDFDQRFKVLLDQVSFPIGPAQHKEWFNAALLPHIRAPLMPYRSGWVEGAYCVEGNFQGEVEVSGYVEDQRCVAA